ncbi:MAG: Uncharacterized protein FD163_1963 [Hyphomonadaceae bacterium]|nr:MAG: Uncharacterized protein FD128_2195 [Hyphomonadaceae bacterium]KAF0184389.1 MAG: Uncharacterized protein FD163_1963 [Hyphomonadaceae bacterium]
MHKKVYSIVIIAASALTACAVPVDTSVAEPVVPIFAAPITQLIGSWSLVEMKGQMLGANIAPPSLNIDGANNIGGLNFHGSSGCNNYFGALSGTMASLSFGQMGATKMACLDNARLVDEQSYFSVLGLAATAQIKVHELSLFDENGRKTAVFVRTPD